jgi:peptidoglycan/LPS O-acetylase OafA/YrhL
MAALAIVVVHVWLVTGQYSEELIPRMVIRLDVCVSLFFMLSAFLLYRPMIAHRAGGPRGPSVSSYARRRFFRIVPVYWVVLTCLAVFPGLAGVLTGDWWAFYSLWFHYDPAAVASECLGTTQLCGLPQTWTLATEITFYALLPLYAVAAAWVARRGGDDWMRRELVLIGALIVAAMALYLLPGDVREEAWFRFSFLGHFDWLGLGLVLAVLSVGLQGRERLPRPLELLSERPGVSMGLALAVYLMMVAALPPIPFPWEPDLGNYLLMHLGHAVIATLVMVPVVFGNPNLGVSRRFLGHPWLVWLGLVSYGMYLWHFSIAYGFGSGGAEASFWPVLLVTLGLSIPLGALSWYLVERPSMRLKYGRKRPKREPAA